MKIKWNKVEIILEGIADDNSEIKIKHGIDRDMKNPFCMFDISNYNEERLEELQQNLLSTYICVENKLKKIK